MLLNDAGGNGKAQPGPTTFGREKRIKKPFLYLGRYPGTCITYL